jgi:acyl-CoA thioesterase-1
MRAAALFLCCSALMAQAPNPAFAPVTDQPGLPRVLLIGDSISIGYTLPVRKLLDGKANVHRIPTNAAHTRNGAEKIAQWLGDGHWDVIHFNFGLHDLRRMDDGQRQVSLEDYEKNLETIVAALKKTGARLIWASTTPVPEGKVSPPRVPADAGLYNDAALRVMNKHGIPVDDLYSFALPRLKQIQRPVNVHFTDAGSDALAAEVARHVEAALAKGKKK